APPRPRGVRPVRRPFVCPAEAGIRHRNVTGVQTCALPIYVVKPRLESLPEVREVALAGLEEKEIIVHLQNDKLTELGIGQESILHSVQQMNVNESIGEFESDKNDLSIRWNTSLETIEDIKDIQIQTSEGLNP